MTITVGNILRRAERKPCVGFFDRPRYLHAPKGEDVRKRQHRNLSVLRLGTLVLLAALSGAACTGESENDFGELDVVWGRRGLSDGRFQKPRAIAIDAQNRIYVIDMTARVQVFDVDGNLLRQPKATPVSKDGRPTGLTIDPDGNLLVADTHYYRVLIYNPDGELLEDETVGGNLGHGPGEFGLVTDAAKDSLGNLYVAEYGEHDRIQKFSPEGEFLLQWGGHGEAPGQFIRPQNIAIDSQDRIWVADACNHRIQVFDSNGELLWEPWGTLGKEPGQLSYPYDLVVNDEYVYIVEYGNHRVQKFTHDGKSLGTWGSVGRGEGQLHNPWGLVLDNQGRMFVLDTMNHRVQRIVL